MDHNSLFRAISEKKSFLCIGLDSDLEKLPPSLLKAKDPVLEFNKRIIDSTHSYAVAYKPNTASMSRGVKGGSPRADTRLHQVQ
jgi:orotidine-5'-phosphate decarboxylase